jgi:PAS domain S-box-containing protein
MAADASRVLILAPTGADAEVAVQLLKAADIVSLPCSDLAHLCEEIAAAAGALLIAEEALIGDGDGTTLLLQQLSQQPPWSDLPVLIMTTSSDGSHWMEALSGLFGAVGNLTLLERPFRAATLVSAIRVALRGRRKQYEVRELLVSERRARHDAAVSLERAQVSENARKLDAERLRLAAEASNLGIWTLDLVTGEVHCTERFRMIYGVPPKQPISQQDLWKRIHPPDLDETTHALRQAIACEQDYVREYRVVWPDQSTHWVAVHGRVTQHDAGRARGMTGIVQEITERKLAEVAREQLLESERAARAHAERLGRMKDEFLATLSHELRTPLNAVVGWTAILRRGGQRTEAELIKGLEVIDRNARLQTQLINDMLDMSRIISGKMHLQISAADLCAIAADAIEAIRPAALAKGLQLSAELGDRHCPVYGDPARLQQIIWNLLSNAVKFTSAGGEVSIVIQPGAEGTVLEVRDNGQGIAATFLPHLFERFRQADGSTTRSHGGLGLGLSIARQLVELHGGTIEAHSAGEGRGATFHVWLPTQHVQPQLPTDALSAAAMEFAGAAEYLPVDELAGARVLVVDDDSDARELIARILGEAKAEVLTAASATRALQYVATAQPPDLIVSDISMPDRDGYEFARAVRALAATKSAATPMIALTAFARPAERERALEAGFDGHLSKPVEPGHLVRTCAQLLKYPPAKPH